MSMKIEYKEVRFCEAGEIIGMFFDGRRAEIQCFNALCEYMLSVDGEFIIRYADNIIGLCKSGEYYRFYVLKEDDGFRIKFKHYASSIVFDTAALDLFLADCGTVNGFFEKNNYTCKKGT